MNSAQYSTSYDCSQEDDLEAWVASLGLGACEPTPVPPPSGIPAILADLAARMAGTPTPANDDLPAPAPAPSLIKKSKIAGSRPRRSQARDHRNLTILKGFEPDMRPSMRKAGKGVPVSVPPSPPKTLSKSPSTTSSPTKSKRQRAAENDNRAAPAWRYTTEIAKGHACVHSVSTTGAGLSWSLNLDGKVLAAANDNPKRFMGLFQDKLAKALKVEFGGPRDFLFSPELSPAGRIHLHGAVDATENERSRMEAILARLGGLYVPAAHAGRQAHTDVLWGPDGWLRYTLKSMAATKRALGLKTALYVTRGCRARAEALWESSR